MDRETMLKRLEVGYNPIDIAIEKWLDIKAEDYWGNTGVDTCALCETYIKPGRVACSGCPLGKCGIGSAYDKAVTNHDADIMLDALYECKNGTYVYKPDIPKRFFSRGQKIRIKGEGIQLLCNCSDHYMCLIDTETGNRWVDHVEVGDVFQITEDEMSRITNRDISDISVVD